MSTIDLYHRTSAAAAAQILTQGRFITHENTPHAFGSTVAFSEYTEGYGDVAVHVRVNEDDALIDDVFDDEEHYRFPVTGCTILGAYTLAPNGDLAAF